MPRLEKLGLKETDWPFPGGIWGNKETEPLHLVIFVYCRLLEIPEAKAELTRYRKKLINEFSSILKPWCYDELRETQSRVNQSGVYEILPTLDRIIETFPLKSEASLIPLQKTFEPWVKKWAIESEIMSLWLVSYYLFEAIVDIFGITRKQLKQQRRKSVKYLVEFLSLLDKRLGWAWEALLTGKYSRAKSATRALARSVVQQVGYRRRQEIATANWADVWVKVRILGWTETQIADELSTGDSSPEIGNISAGLEPFDLALGYIRDPGAPKGKSRFMSRKRGSFSEPEMHQKS